MLGRLHRADGDDSVAGGEYHRQLDVGRAVCGDVDDEVTYDAPVGRLRSDDHVDEDAMKGDVTLIAHGNRRRARPAAGRRDDDVVRRDRDVAARP